jgi:hypothetical protein
MEGTMLHHNAPPGHDWHSRRQRRAVVWAMAEEATGQAAGQLVPGWTVVLRRQPARIVDGQPQDGYTDAFELICCDCGDDPDLDYRDATAEVQQIRGPYTTQSALPHMNSMCGTTGGRRPHPDQSPEAPAIVREPGRDDRRP